MYELLPTKISSTPRSITSGHTKRGRASTTLLLSSQSRGTEMTKHHTRHEIERERQKLIDRQIRANNSLMQATNPADFAYWREKRASLEKQIFSLNAMLWSED